MVVGRGVLCVVAVLVAIVGVTGLVLGGMRGKNVKTSWQRGNSAVEPANDGRGVGKSGGSAGADRKNGTGPMTRS